ncbi:MAG: hypothetical protein LBR91_02990 [Puniceicoccales bacterium]|jgi:hypothetical protein|nr:hypothetical protein [Puniceicoccales bacterium]
MENFANSNQDNDFFRKFSQIPNRIVIFLENFCKLLFVMVKYKKAQKQTDGY